MNFSFKTRKKIKLNVFFDVISQNKPNIYHEMDKSVFLKNIEFVNLMFLGCEFKKSIDKSRFEWSFNFK